MSNRTEYIGSVSLIITGHELDPEVVTSVLKMKPDRAWKRGDAIGSARVPARAKEGGWKQFAAQSRRSSYFEPQLAAWVAALRPKASAIRRLTARGYYCRLSWFAASSETISVLIPVSMQRSLAALGLAWELSFQLATEDATKHLVRADA